MTEREYKRRIEAAAQKVFAGAAPAPRGKTATLRLCKQFLRLKEQRIKQRHRAGWSGVEICRMRSDVLDHLIRVLWEECVAAQPGAEALKISVVAHGGFGRRVMSPGSDVDLTFMLPGNGAQVPPAVATLVSTLQTALWDLNLKVGQGGTRSVGDCLRHANGDPHAMTALIEARFLTGDEAAFQEFRKRFDAECIEGREKEFLRQRQEDLATRHEKYGGTPFVQEPHVKNGCGGLRDYQNLIWMTYAKLRTLDPRDLVTRGLIAPGAWKEVEAAYDLILRVRNEVHYSERRGEDLLTLRLQGVVAGHLGYRHKRVLRRIEAFMKDYYMATRDVLQRSSEIMDRFHLEALEGSKTKRGLLGFLARRKDVKRADRFDGFISRNGRIFPESETIFQEDHARLMRLFSHTQQRHLRLSPELFQLVQKSFRLVNASFRYSKEVREVFEAILTRRGDVARTLRQMHRVGFLGRYLPEFGALTCLVQHEFFHRFTADEHTLRTLERLDELSGPPQAGGPGFYQQLFHDLQQPSMLYLALIMHDTGRAANKKSHDDESTLLADTVARRLLIKGERRKLLLFLVDNHLLMYRVATTSNLEDPKVIEDFVQIVRTKENLDSLLVMTYADSRGTSEASWSGYKEASIRHLYHNALEFMQAPADFMRRASVPLDEVRAEVDKLLPADFADEITAHFEHMPRSYFNFREPAQIEAHIRQFRSFFVQLAKEDAEAGLLPVMTWNDFPVHGYSELVVTCWDRHLLLARISGALAAESINILSADLFQRSDHLVLDIFRVCTTNLTAVTSRSAKQRVENAVRAAFVGQVFDFAPAIAKSRRSVPGYDEVMAEIPQRVHINNDLSPEHTVVELQMVDRLGLLHDIFMAIGKLGLSVTHARIATEKGVALDAVYVQDANGHKLETRRALDTLSARIEEAVFG